MKTSILITAATEKELHSINTAKYNSFFDFASIATGIGALSTVYAMMSYLSANKRPDYIINVGIAGTFTSEIEIGDTVIVESDCLADIGIENKSGFRSAWETGLINPSEFPFENGFVKCDPEISNMFNDEFRLVRGITVNTVSGTIATIDRHKEKFSPDVETMEVAAALYVARMENVPLIALRSISNYIEPRNRDAWDILAALAALQPAFDEILKKIDTK